MKNIMHSLILFVIVFFPSMALAHASPEDVIFGFALAVIIMLIPFIFIVMSINGFLDLMKVFFQGYGKISIVREVILHLLFIASIIICWVYMANNTMPTIETMTYSCIIPFPLEIVNIVILWQKHSNYAN